MLLGPSTGLLAKPQEMGGFLPTGLLSPWKNEETWGSLVLQGMWEE